MTASSKLTATQFGVRNPNVKNALDWEIQGVQNIHNRLAEFKDRLNKKLFLLI